MKQVSFHATIDAPWTNMDPVRLGLVPTGLGSADVFVKVEVEERPLLRIDLYGSSEESYAFRDARLWLDFVAIGWGNRIYLVQPETRRVVQFELDSYFGHMYPERDRLLVASAERLFCVATDGSLLWKTKLLGIDGVVVDCIEDGKVKGQGEWDPPGGWRPFTVSMHSGDVVLA